MEPLVSDMDAANTVDSPTALLLATQERLNDVFKEFTHISVTSKELKSAPFVDLFTQRCQIVKTIPNFWLTVLLSHPAFTFLITSTETQILRYCIDIDVRPNNPQASHPGHFDIVFSFAPNPYLCNDSLTLVKRYTYSDTTGRVVHFASHLSFTDTQTLDYDEDLGLLDWLAHDTHDSAHLGELIRDQIFPFAIELFFGTFSTDNDPNEFTSFQ